MPVQLSIREVQKTYVADLVATRTIHNSSNNNHHRQQQQHSAYPFKSFHPIYVLSHIMNGCKVKVRESVWIYIAWKPPLAKRHTKWKWLKKGKREKRTTDAFTFSVRTQSPSHRTHTRECTSNTHRDIVRSAQLIKTMKNTICLFIHWEGDLGVSERNTKSARVCSVWMWICCGYKYKHIQCMLWRTQKIRLDVWGDWLREAAEIVESVASQILKSSRDAAFVLYIIP